MTAPLPLAILGGGLIGRRHAALAMDHADIDLTALVEPDADLRASLAAQGLPVAPDLDAVPAKTKAVIIATPNQNHEDTGLAAAARGWAILMEKPVAHDLSAADRLIAGCARAGVPLLVGHHRRHHPFVAEAKRRLPGLGPLIALQGLWCLRKPDSYFAADWRRQAGGGPILINLIHEIDMLRHLAGDITEIGALSSDAARPGPVEDTAAVTLRFASGALGSFVISDAAASPWGFEAASGENPHIGTTGQDCLQMIGPKGALHFPSLTLWQNGNAPDWSRALRRTPPPELPRLSPLRAQLDHFIAVTKGADPLVTGEDARATLAATLAVSDAAKSGRTIRLTTPMNTNPVETGPPSRQRSLA